MKLKETRYAKQIKKYAEMLHYTRNVNVAMESDLEEESLDPSAPDILNICIWNKSGAAGELLRFLYEHNIVDLTLKYKNIATHKIEYSVV